MFLRRLLLLTASLVLIGLAWPQQADRLYSDFQNPPADARPFVRWWWNGNYVTEKEVLRELDVMKAAGIGGVEINPIAMPPEVSAESRKNLKALEWLSPEWNQALKAATQGARQRGMTADIIVGSGWPFGGRFLQPNEQIQRIALVRRELTGPQRFEAKVQELQPRRSGGRSEGGETSPAQQRLAFLRLVPADLPAFEPGKDVTGAAGPDGRIRIDVPAGKFILYAGLQDTGFSNVKLGAPGADGPVVDHLNAQAVGGYLNRLSSTLNPALGGKLGTGLRAMFVDSLELDRANWTGDFAAEFQKRRGYALDPYLPFLLDRDSGGASAFADTVRRARYDFNLTLVELFQERFLKTYIDWCHQNGVLGRIQAYGRETHPLEGSMHVDLPEGESWLWGDADKVVPGPTVADKYVSSGAHLAGKQLVSFEAMTNTVPVFRETLEDLKAGLDMSLLTGVNHPVLHGFNYNPPEAGFPGWVRFGSYFNEKNTWWPYFRLWADYSARLTAVLRQTTASAEVAILGPRADEWSREGLLYQPFPEVHLPWYHYHLWQALQQNGVSSDYISESILRAAKFDKGEMRYGAREYEAVILMDVESLEPATAEALRRCAQAGGKIVFIGVSPSRAPGLKDAAAQDLLVRQHIEAALKAAGQRAAVIPAPKQQVPQTRTGNINQLGLPLADRQNLLSWAGSMLKRFSITPAVQMSSTSPWVSHIRQQREGRDFFFFTNTSRTAPAAFEAMFPTGSRRAWRWDPFTGNRRPYPAASSANRLSIWLAPEESLLLVFEPQGASISPAPAAGVEPSQLRMGSEVTTLAPVWDVAFSPVNGVPAFQRKFDQLIDLSKAAADPSLATFAGTAIYRTEFDVPDQRRTLLSLGEVYNVSEVTLNGKPLGVRWYGQHLYDARGVLQAGRNRLEIKVTVMLGNYVKSLQSSNAVAKRWAGWFPPIPAGLVGPLQLAAPAN